MDKQIFQYLLFLLFAVAFTIYWGKAMTFCKNSKLINSFVRFLMRYSRSQFDPIKFYTMIILYSLISLLGTVVLGVSFGFNIFEYFSLEGKYIIYIFIGFVAEVSLSSLILLIIAAIKTNINWYAVIQEITWVSLISNPICQRLYGPFIRYWAHLVKSFSSGEVFSSFTESISLRWA